MSGEDFVRSLIHLNYAYTQAIGEIMNDHKRRIDGLNYFHRDSVRKEVNGLSESMCKGDFSCQS